MTLKSIVLAGAALIALAAPAAAQADPEWGHDRGYHEGWRNRDERSRAERREHARGEDRRYGHRWGYGPRCFIERRAYYNWHGEYVVRPVQVCR